MTVRYRNIVPVGLAMVLVAAACSSGDDSSDPTTPAETTPPSVAEPATSEPGTTEAPVVTDAPPTTGDVDPAVIAVEWLSATSGLDAAIVDQLQVAETVNAGPVSHVTFQHTVSGRRVIGSEITVHVLADGAVQGASESISSATPGDAQATIDEAAAASIASKAVDGTIEGEPGVESVWAQIGADLVPAWLVSLSTSNPVGSWRVVIDAATSVVIANDRGAQLYHGYRSDVPAKMGAKLPVTYRQTGGDACDAPAAPSACVFMNPYAANGGSVEPANANDFLFGVPLLGLDSADQLIGEFVTTAPAGAPQIPDAEADQVWAGGVGSRNFEAAMSYYWLDRTQRLMQELGFSIRADAPTEIVPVFAEEVDNAFFDANADRISMGVGSNGINSAQDASVLVHEYGHAVLDAQLGTETHYSSEEIGAYSEGFGDIFANLTTVEFRSNDPACLGGWFALTNDCLRRLDGDKVYPADLERQPHDDGEIFTGAVWDVFESLLGAEGLSPTDCFQSDVCTSVRNRLLTVVLGSHFYIAAGASLVDIANAYLLANESSFADADRDVFTAAFDAHGLLGDSATTIDETGQQPDAPTGVVSVGVDIFHDYRGDLLVTVGVVDANYELLCDEIELAAPDGSDDGDNLVGIVDVSDTSCAAFVPPSPDQLWYLYAEDTLADDEGELLEFVVFDGDNPYPAGGLPLLIPDGNPEGTFALVDGAGSTVPQEGQVEPGAPVAGQPYISLDVTHTYNGDLSIRSGVADVEGNIVCSVPIQNPDPADDAGGVFGDVDMTECAGFYPPTEGQRWFLEVIDTAALDEGTVDLFAVTGPDGTRFDFFDVPQAIPDDNVDGVVLILDGGVGSSGQVGGSGQSSGLEFPLADIQVAHTYAGDLAITAGVVDANFDVLCEVVLRTADAEDSSVDFGGVFSLAECDRFYPPSPDQIWYLFVRDTLAEDVGTVTNFSLNGIDGQVFTSVDAGLEIPDANQDGVAALIYGDEVPAAGAGAPVVSYGIGHTYVGDLYVEIGVENSFGELLCGVIIQEPDPEFDGVDLFGDVALDECSFFYPPSPDQVWYIYAADVAELDVGSIDTFLINGPDGGVWDASNITPFPIPDNDPAGAFVWFDG